MAGNDGLITISRDLTSPNPIAKLTITDQGPDIVSGFADVDATGAGAELR
ncbi:MAG: hypothetical protein ACRDSH_02025 [Pseudonocardiaceae bacterium]